MNESAKPRERKVVKEIEIDAPVERVWEAITEARHLTCWYPLEASVTPGAGGSMTISFGPGMDSTERILVWEPGRHLRTLGGPPGAPPPDVLPSFAEWLATSPTTMGPNVLDFFLEARGGKTLVRLVHSGFLSGAAWEEEFFDGLEKGWPGMLAHLQFYMKHHWGTPRIVAWPTRMIAVTEEEAWKRIMSPRGLLAEGTLHGLRPGDPFSIRCATGHRLEGTVSEITEQKVHLVVANWNNALFSVMIEKCGGLMAGLWFSTYGVPKADVDGFAERWRQQLEELFPEPMPAQAESSAAATS